MKTYPTKRSFPNVFSVFLVLGILISCATGHGQEILKSIDAPGPEVRGLAWDGQYLWCSEPMDEEVYQLDPADGQIISSFNFSMDYSYGGLGWGLDDYLWITDYKNGQSWFYKVDPVSGDQVAAFHCPGG